MPSTYLSLHYHIVFSTRNREPIILDEWRVRLYDYMGGIIRSLGGYSVSIGGTDDHIHILAGLKSTHRLSDFVRDLKKASSMWIHESLDEHFAWQKGYGACTINATAVPQVKRYIENQESHHRDQSFRDALIGFLKQAKVPFDPQFWD